MASFAVPLCAIALVLGTLAVTPVSPDVRAVAIAASILLAAASRGTATRLWACVVLAFAAGALNAELPSRAPAAFAEQRTARY
ncbi:MAG: hypothetical protein JO030_05360, partial [Candidatus Eremiobacteraeota bacterium]|nr:hypothetical protein [Candidatus Eremiobacteraeota bacterium]